VCGDCGAPYRRRTERGKESCPQSPTLDEGWVQDTLGEAVCLNGIYDDVTIRNEVYKVQIFDTYILIFRTEGSQDK